MDISTSIGTFIGKGISFKEIVKMCSKAGFDCIDFSFDALDFKKEYSDEEFYELKEYAKSLGIYFNQAHAPFPPVSDTAEKNKFIFKSIVRSMELASILGAKNIIVHPITNKKHNGNEEELAKANYDFYSSLIPYCEKYNIRVAVENLYGYDDLRKRFTITCCTSPYEHKKYIDMMNSPYIVACLDVGHLVLMDEDPYNAIKILGHERLKAFHMHDVNYVEDSHTLPGIFKVDFKSIMKGIREINYDGEFTLESDYFFSNFENEFMPTVLKFAADRARFIVDKL